MLIQLLMKRDADRYSFPPEWASGRSRKDNLRDDLQLFLGDVARAYGMTCAPDDILKGESAISADDFARSVLIAEGFSEDELPYDHSKWLSEVFTARYGASISPADYERNFAERPLSTNSGHKRLVSAFDPNGH